MSAAAQRHRRSGKSGDGFTLIEVLVIVIIIGIVSAVVLLSFGVLGDDRAMQQQARRFASLVDLAADESLMQGRDYGVEFTRSGYRFLEYDPLSHQWQEIIGDEIFRPRQLDEGLDLELVLEDRNISLGERFAEAATDGEGEEDEELADDFAPHVLIMSSGEVTPFNLYILRPADRSELHVEMSVTGEIEIQQAAQALP
ncbi:MAG TPA: type II secretion system minor pseudopilin GspH [Woeseiaceae bacterium]|nr:type II secretion system minor pseudopilin GspH [Woeseiaceae bacterium]